MKDSCGYACHQDYKCNSDHNSNTNFLHNWGSCPGYIHQPENVRKLNESIITECFKCETHYAY
jgi:hypothetical protein